MTTLSRLLGSGLIDLLAIRAAVWGALALWFAFPAVDGLRAALALGFAALGVGGLLTAVLRRRLVAPLLPFDETGSDGDTIGKHRGATFPSWSLFQSLFVLTFKPIGRSHPGEVHFNNDTPRHSNDG